MALDTAGRRGALGCSGCGCAGGSGICGAPAEMMGGVSPRQLATPVARANRCSRGSWRVTVPPVETRRSGAPRPALSGIDSEMLPPISAIGKGKRAFPAAAAAAVSAAAVPLALPALAAAADEAGGSKRRQPLAQSSNRRLAPPPVSSCEKVSWEPPASSWTSCALKRSAVKTTPSALSSGGCTVRRSNVARAASSACRWL